MNAYAGRVYLSLEAQARLRITDPYSIHRALLDLIDGERCAAPETSSGLLWVDHGQTLYGRRIRLSEQASRACRLFGERCFA